MNTQEKLQAFLKEFQQVAPNEAKLLADFCNLPNIGPRLLKAPASSAIRYHQAYSGGLIDHSIDVVRITLRTALNQCTPYTENGITGFYPTHERVGFIPTKDIYLAGFLHDFNKIGDVTGQEWYLRNVLKNGSVSDKIPFATNDNLYKTASLAPGPGNPEDQATKYLVRTCWENMPEGDLSLSLVYAYAPLLFAALSEDAKFTIRHHDGYYGNGRNSLRGKESPLQIMLHYADMWSSRIGNEDLRSAVGIH